MNFGMPIVRKIRKTNDFKQALIIMTYIMYNTRNWNKQIVSHNQYKFVIDTFFC